MMKLFDVGKIHSFLQSINPLPKFRIVYKNKRYIVQQRVGLLYRGIDVNEPYVWRNWFTLDSQLNWCSFGTQKAAEDFMKLHIEDYEMYKAKPKVIKAY